MSSFRTRNLIRRYRYDASGKPWEAPAREELESRHPPASSHDTATLAPAAEAIAESLLARSRAEADRILAEALKQAQELRQQAEAEGRQRGFEAGRAEGLATLEERIQKETERMYQLLESIRAERKQVLARTEGELVELALAIARKVIGDVALKETDAVVFMVQQAVEQLGQDGPCQVHLHPEDVKRLTAHWGKEKKPWELAPDERLSPGSCIVACGATTVDARPETQLAIIRRSFSTLQGGS